MKDIVDLLARILIAVTFIYEAYDILFHIGQTKALMTEYGLEWRQDLLVFGAIFNLLIGGVLVLIGYRSGLGAMLLLFYWIPVTFIVHSFWNDPQDMQQEQSILFMKNLSIVGALLMVYVNGSGKYSVKRLISATRLKP